MKNIYMMLLACLCCLGACQDETRPEEAVNEVESRNSLTLTLKSMAQTPATRAEEAGDDTYNENLLKAVNVYFFSDTQQPYVFSKTGLAVGADGKLKVKIEEDMYDKTYTIYVVANAPADYSTAAETLAGLQAKQITTEWKDGLTANADLTEESLLMHGSKEVEIKIGGSATIELKRAMAKVVLTPVVDESIVIDDVTYVPDLSSMNVTFVNGVKTTTLDGTYIPQADDYITRMKRTYSDGATHIPFYSYPNPADNADRLESYLILCIPWGLRDAAGNLSYHDYYYYVPITGGVTTLEANCYYKVTVNVGILGSLDPRELVKLESDFLVMDWYSMTLDAEMKEYRFLVLDSDVSMLYNQETVLLPYISSSPIDMVEVVSVEYIDYLEEDLTQATRVLTGTEIGSEYAVTVEGENIKFTHPVENMYAPYTITIRVSNTDGNEKTWTITQYPGIYITGDKARGKVFVAEQYCEESYNGDYKKVYYPNSDSYNLGSVQKLSTVEGNESTTSTTNCNNYIISISALKEGDDYAIGDPRSLTVDNLDMPDLNNYHPTRTSGTEKVIAPEFLIASSRGKTQSVTFENAERRCSAFQEDGYPAGRWRLPTEAEIKFVVDLSENEIIPKLFNGAYWCATSYKYYDSDNQGFTVEEDHTKTHFVRCVYDIWYWGTEQVDPEEFSWKDSLE